MLGLQARPPYLTYTWLFTCVMGFELTPSFPWSTLPSPSCGLFCPCGCGIGALASSLCTFVVPGCSWCRKSWFTLSWSFSEAPGLALGVVLQAYPNNEAEGENLEFKASPGFVVRPRQKQTKNNSKKSILMVCVCICMHVSM